MSSLIRALVLALIVTGLGAVTAASYAVQPVATLSGTVTAADGPGLGSTILRVQVLNLGDDSSYATPQDTQLLPAGSPADFALTVSVPGPYILVVTPVQVGGGASPYLRAWYGGAGQPSRFDDPGVVMVDENLTSVTGLGIVLHAGTTVTGTVHGTSGSPVAGATVSLAEWTTSGGVDQLATIPDVRDPISRADGSWAVTVPTGTPLALSVRDRTGYAPWVLGGSTATRTAANTLVADPGATQDIALTVSWPDLGRSGAVVEDETCLQQQGSGSTVVNGLALDVRTSGLVGGSDADPPGTSPFASGLPVLAPYWTGTPRTLTWGTSDDGTELCALWQGVVDNLVVQLVATAVPDDPASLHVVFNYGTVGVNPFVIPAEAGWSDGSDPHLLDGPYDDDSVEGLIHHSLDADVDGRYRFDFDGFAEAAAINDVAPSLTQEPDGDGVRLVADPGSWTVSGGTQDDLTFTYRWFRRGTLVGEGSDDTMLVDTRIGDTYTVRVVASRPGYRRVSSESEAVYVATAPYLAAETAPAVTGALVAGSTLTATPGTWRTEDTPDYDYRWTVDGEDRSGTDHLTLTAGDTGKEVALTVTARLPSHRDGRAFRRIGTVQPAGTVPRDLVVTVLDEHGDPVSDATVAACVADTGICLVDGTGSGHFDGQAYPGTTYDVRVTPRWDSGLRAETRSVTVPATGPVAPVVVRLRAPLAPPTGTTITPDFGDRDGVPVVSWGEETTLEFDGCPRTPSPSYVLTFHDGTPSISGELAESADGRYAASLPPLSLGRGHATLTTDVPADCDTPALVSFDVVIDPYGEVVDQYGRPIDRAEVTLFRADDLGDPLTFVPGGSPEIADSGPSPDDTLADGWFYWAPSAGWYVVEAGADDCATGATSSMQIDPPSINALIRLDCDVAPPEPTTPLTIHGTFRQGRTVTAEGGSFGDGLATTIQWLRGDTVVGTGRSYVVRAADVDHELRARATGVRPDFVPDPERGDPVSFTPTSVDSAVVTPGSPPSVPPVPPVVEAPVGSVPVVLGRPVPGQVLTLDGPVWDDGGPSTAYQWLRDGQAISGATGPTLAVTLADVTHTLSVRVDAARDGAPTGRTTSGGIAVPRLVSSVRAKAVRTPVAARTRPRLDVVVTAAGGIPTGTVKVRDGSRVLTDVTLVRSDDGLLRIVLPRLSPGVHRLEVRYLGDDLIASSKVSDVRVKVRRR